VGLEQLPRVVEVREEQRVDDERVDDKAGAVTAPDATLPSSPFDLAWSRRRGCARRGRVGSARRLPESGGGWNWYAFVFAALETALTVFGPVWLLAVAQRRLNRRLRWAGPAASRSAYGAFILQSVVLIGLAMAMRPLPLPAEVKAVLLATAGLAGSFGFAWLLISRVPGVARIL